MTYKRFVVVVILLVIVIVVLIIIIIIIIITIARITVFLEILRRLLHTLHAALNTPDEGIVF